MPSELYVSSSGVNRRIKEVYALAGGVNRTYKEIWAVAGGVNRKVFVGGKIFTASTDDDWSGGSSIYLDCVINPDGSGKFSSYKDPGEGSSTIYGYINFAFEEPLFINPGNRVGGVQVFGFSGVCDGYRTNETYSNWRYNTGSSGGSKNAKIWVSESGTNNNFTFNRENSAITVNKLTLFFRAGLKTSSSRESWFTLEWRSGGISILGNPITQSVGALPIYD